MGSLDDKTNFANLIQKQATLIENLEKEKKRSKYLESKVKLNKSFDAGTQTHSDDEQDEIPKASILESNQK